MASTDLAGVHGISAGSHAGEGTVLAAQLPEAAGQLRAAGRWRAAVIGAEETASPMEAASMCRTRSA